MEERYLSVICEAEEELCIIMAYFSPIPSFMRAITDACRRGVRVTLVIPSHANFQNDLNRKTVRRLLHQTKGAVTVCLSPKMLHTKLILTEKTLSFGSTNITKKAFAQLSELNLFLPRTDCPFVRDAEAYVRGIVEASKRVADAREIKYRRPIAFLEGLIV